MAYYVPGQEPKKIGKYLYALLEELDDRFPDSIIDMSRWNHDRWDKMMRWLIEELGYESRRDLLEAYGFKLMSENPQRRKITQSSQRKKKKNRFTVVNSLLLVIGLVVFVFGIMFFMVRATGSGIL